MKTKLGSGAMAATLPAGKPIHRCWYTLPDKNLPGMKPGCPATRMLYLRWCKKFSAAIPPAKPIAPEQIYFPCPKTAAWWCRLTTITPTGLMAPCWIAVPANNMHGPISTTPIALWIKKNCISYKMKSGAFSGIPNRAGCFPVNTKESRLGF